MDRQSKKDISEQYKNRTVIGGIYCIRCQKANQAWVRKTTDMQGSKNRHAFSLATKSCPEPSMLPAWKEHGAETFTFEVLEALTKKETQTTSEFEADIGALFDLWEEKLAAEEGEKING